MTSVSNRISFRVLPAEIENTIWSYLDLHDKYPYTRVLNCTERAHLPEFKNKRLAIHDNEKKLLVNFAQVIYNTFLSDDLYHTDDNQQEIAEINSVSRDRELLPKYKTTYEHHAHPICNDINLAIKTHLFDDIKMVNGKPIVRKNTYIDEINKDKCTPHILHLVIHYFTNLRLYSKQPWAIKFNKRMEERVYKLTILYRIVMRKFCKLRNQNIRAFKQQVALEDEQRKKRREAEKEAAKQEKLQAKEAAKQERLRAKEAAKAEKLQAKEAAKQEKIQAKEAATQQKLRAKQELIAMKKADKEAKKILCR